MQGHVFFSVRSEETWVRYRIKRWFACKPNKKNQVRNLLISISKDSNYLEIILKTVYGQTGTKGVILFMEIAVSLMERRVSRGREHGSWPPWHMLLSETYAN